MPTPTRIAVAGATGRVGRHVVELLEVSGRDVVPMSRSMAVDVVTGDSLTNALSGVECIIDASSGSAASSAGAARPTPEAAREFFTASARNLHQVGLKAGVQRMVEVSVIGIDLFTAGYGAAKLAHEIAMLTGTPSTLRSRSSSSFRNR